MYWGRRRRDLFDSNNDSDFVWAWGQFIDHDLDLTNTSDVPFNIAVPTGDPTFDPLSLGNQTLPDSRSVTDPTTGASTSNPLNFPNSITSWIDGSMIYGSDPTRARRGTPDLRGRTSRHQRQQSTGLQYARPE